MSTQTAAALYCFVVLFVSLYFITLTEPSTKDQQTKELYEEEG